ncbi:MAG TPA: glycosyltransferase family 9 protein [Verrucomicrobiae bacterium]
MPAKENILLIRLKSIGDIVFTLPAVRAVRENFPRAKLHFLVSKEYASLLRGFSDVDEIISVDREVYHAGNFANACAATFKLLRELRARNFSRVIDFQGYGETELLAWWSGAPERWGNVYHPPRGWAYSQGVTRLESLHPAEANLFLLQQCGLKIDRIVNGFILPEDALEKARQFFAANNLDAARPTLFIQPLTSATKKNWPLKNYLELAAYFQSRGLQIIFGGGPADRAALESVRAAGFVVSAGSPLLISAGLMKLSTLVVGGDTGLLHLAVALGRRVVMLMRSNSRVHTHPFQHADWAVKSSSGQSILTVEIGAVLETIEQVLNLKTA